MSMNQKENQRISLTSSRETDWRQTIPNQINSLSPGLVEVDCTEWRLSCRDLKRLVSLLKRSGLKISIIKSSIPETIVSASAMGHQTHLNLEKQKEISISSSKEFHIPKASPKLLFHQGTLRSGDHLTAEGDILLLGDVNPGARISAGGDILIWGRLRGIAHAGTEGNLDSKIIALQLRPLQLRIADKVARGPQEAPDPGLAEEARIEKGKILIFPARVNAFKTKRINQ